MCTFSSDMRQLRMWGMSLEAACAVLCQFGHNCHNLPWHASWLESVINELLSSGIMEGSIRVRANLNCQLASHNIWDAR